MTSTAISSVSIPMKTYKYSSEISQMCFVFEEGYQQPEEEVVHYIEDIVKSQLTEILSQARTLASRRGSRGLVSVEDLIFLIRHDKSKINRLRTYLSWKDVRKNAKDVEEHEAPELESMIESASDKGLRVNKIKTKLAWDIINIYSEHLNENSDDENEDEIEGYEASKKRLKQADERTKAMTKEQYTHFTECRQASFTYRKGKRFRDFVNIAAFSDAPSDELIDILGFLAYEIVRSLCEVSNMNKKEIIISKATAEVIKLKEQRKLEEERLNSNGKGKGKGKEKEKKRSHSDSKGEDEVESNKDCMQVDTKSPVASTSISSPNKSRKLDSISKHNNPLLQPRILINPQSLFSEPAEFSNDKPSSSGLTTPGGTHPIASTKLGGGSQDKLTLELSELAGTYVGMQLDKDALKACGMRNWRAGGASVRKGRLGLI